MIRASLFGIGLLYMTLPGVTAAADIYTEEVRYYTNETEMHGFVAWDISNSDPRPGILVVHEWWGQNEHARESARRLAKMGYTALAVDMYGNGRTADHPDDARAMASHLQQNADLAAQRFAAAEALLRNHPTVAGNRLAAIGYCFGGTVVLEMARGGAHLRGVASVHGALATSSPARLGMTRPEVLVLHGKADPMVPTRQVEAFHREMREAGIKYRIVGFEGARHAFTNPESDRIAEEFDLPVAYDATATEASWKELERFLSRIMAD